MKNILLVHASPRGDRSHSRRLAEAFAARCLTASPSMRVTRREVGRTPPLAVTEAWVAAAFYPQPEERPPYMEADLSASETLIEEVFSHDLIVISTPMYNYSVPSGLKAWVDQIIRKDRTVRIVQKGGQFDYQPMVHGKRVIVVTTRGGTGFGPGGPYAQMNHADTWLRDVLAFIGMTDLEVLAAESDEIGGEVFQEQYGRVQSRLVELAHGL